MQRIIIIFSILILAISCKNNVDCGIDPIVIKSNDSIISNVESDLSGQKWWNDYLKKLEEPTLKNLKKESYRLMIYNTREESSKTYRIYKTWNSYKLVYKEFGKEDSYGIATKLVLNRKSELSKNEWFEFQELLQNIGFWSLPVRIDRIGFGGTNWLLEGRNPSGNQCTNREYHAVVRWQPIDTMKVMKLNYKLIELSEK